MQPLESQLSVQLSVQLRGQLWSQLHDQLSVQLWNQLMNQLSVQLEYQLWDNVVSRLEALWDHNLIGTGNRGPFNGSNNAVLITTDVFRRVSSFKPFLEDAQFALGEKLGNFNYLLVGNG